MMGFRFTDISANSSRSWSCYLWNVNHLREKFIKTKPNQTEPNRIIGSISHEKKTQKKKKKKVEIENCIKLTTWSIWPSFSPIFSTFFFLIIIIYSILILMDFFIRLIVLELGF